jgi:hypothetical protein
MQLEVVLIRLGMPTFAEQLQASSSTKGHAGKSTPVPSLREGPQSLGSS